ncbi:MAG: RagB/SusD family nutrient uptake outer membrane protein [Bacteroidales bacterium]|jgi:hypothetical protein|nr:RagB/SusD family nutrient uptake outer membrane protein [Bacteroidales bacterium]
MKTINLIMAALFAACIFGCDDYLDKQPTEELTLDKVFQSRIFAQNFLSNIYRATPLESNFADAGAEFRSPWVGGCDEMEIAYGGSYTHDINAGAWNPTNITSIPIWYDSYIPIRKANIFLERVDEVPTGQTEKDTWKGEAYFLRAFFHFQLMRAYGPVIILDRQVQSDDDFQSFVRRPVQEVADFIAADCRRADSLLLPTKPAGESGRVTSIAALALKSRALLYAASPLWTENADYTANFKNYDGEELAPALTDGQRQQLWQKAANAALDCITQAENNGYGLYRAADNDPVANYGNIWQEHYNREWLFWKQCGDFQHGNRCADPIGIGGFSILNPTQEMVDAYEMADGSTPITGYTNDGLTPVINGASGYGEDGFSATAHPKGYYPAGVWKMYENREPRFYASINFAKQIWKTNRWSDVPHTLEFWFRGIDGKNNAGSDYCKTGYLMRKIVDHQFNIEPWRIRVHNWVYFRLGEIYLNYAEALNEAQGPVADVYKYVNEIRDRSGLPGLPTNLDKTGMRAKIHHERRIELAFETHRFFDVRRWMEAGVSENRPVHSLDIFSGENGNDPDFYNRIKVEDRIFEPKHYLFPISQAEINKNLNNLVQAPGWQ